MPKISTERLVKAGFLLTACEDGKFWVLERPPGDEAERVAAVCQEFLPDLDTTAVAEEIVLQCDSDFKDPVLYMDGYLWNLGAREFSDILTRLARRMNPPKRK